MKYVLIALGAVFVVVIILLIAMLASYDRRTPEEFLKVWKEVVESGDEKEYMKLWDERAQEKNLAHYKEALDLMKKPVFVSLTDVEKKDSDKQVAFSGISIQIRQGDAVTHTKKRLVIARRGFGRTWKIMDEETYTPSLPKPSATAAAPKKTTEGGLPSSGKAPLDTDLKIRQIVEDWRLAWEEKDVDRYVSKYADFAEITRVTVIGGKEYPIKLTKEELRRRMMRLWKKYSKIEVRISNLEVTGDLAVAEANFLQEYTAWSPGGTKIAYHDLGTKKLSFVRDVKDNSWKIISESWKIYKKVPGYPKL